MEETKIPSVLNKQENWENLYFYRKSDVIYQLSFTFCDRFIHLYKDRTRDQVIQAARSCKQNIVEGLADGVTSTEMQLKLLNVARASLKELKEDFSDYLKSRHLTTYSAGQPHYDAMLNYCRSHNDLSEYEPLFMQWTDEEMCNYGLTLCHMIDKMMLTYLKKLDEDFVKNGGIKERMHRARTGYRQQQDERLKELEAEHPQLEQRIASLMAQVEDTKAQVESYKAQVESYKQQLAEALAANAQWQSAYDDLKQRALAAYNRQQAEINELKAKLKSQEKEEEEKEED